MKKLLIGFLALGSISSFGQTCGTYGSIKERIADCDTQNKHFALVTRTVRGHEVYKSLESELIWSDKLDGVMNYSDSAKACDEVRDELGNISELDWTMPSMHDFTQMEYYSEIKVGLPNMNSWFWTSTHHDSGASPLFNGNSFFHVGHNLLVKNRTRVMFDYGPVGSSDDDDVQHGNVGSRCVSRENFNKAHPPVFSSKEVELKLNESQTQADCESLMASPKQKVKAFLASREFSGVGQLTVKIDQGENSCRLKIESHNPALSVKKRTVHSFTVPAKGKNWLTKTNLRCIEATNELVPSTATILITSKLITTQENELVCDLTYLELE